MIDREAELRAHKKFLAAGMTVCGSCGLIANLEKESDGFIPSRLEYYCAERMKFFGVTDKYGKYYTQESYTKYLNNGQISCEEFLHPVPGKQYGYGLAQWTSPSRKSGLWNLAHEKGVAMDNEDMQIEYLLYELRTLYPHVLSVLKTAASVQEASDYVLVHFEEPANANALKAERAQAGIDFYNECVKGASMTTYKTVDEVIDAVINLANTEVGYLEKASNSNLDSKTGNAGSANYTKYWRDIYPAFQGQPWCAIFVAWIMYILFGLAKATSLLKHWPYTYCPTLAGMTSNKTPKKGSIVIFFRNGTYTHTGLVTAVNGRSFNTIEGNTSGDAGIVANGGGVFRKSYNLDNLSSETKFFMPDYSIVLGTSKNNQTGSGTGSTETQQSTTGGSYMFSVGTVKNGSTGNDVKLLQRLLRSNGIKDPAGQTLSIDGDCGAKTVHAIKTYQTKKGLVADGECGDKTWKSILLR